MNSTASRPLSILGYSAAKRSMDAIGAGFLLAITSPILSACLLAVWLDSGRPVIYRRRVVGLDHHEFDAFKIRTMVPNADEILERNEDLHARFRQSNKLVTDPRITRTGHWLRRFSLDELPQLINVIRGQMSLVGPRMITAAELPEWGETARLRASVRPGITGSWQVSGRQTLSKEQRILLDAEYVRRLSMRQDLLILVRTIPAMLSARGAY